MANAGWPIHVRGGPQGHWEQRPWAAAHVQVPSISTELTHSVTQATFAELKGRSALPLAPGHDVCEAPVCFHLTITVKPSMLLWRHRLRPHGSARGRRSDCACSPELCDIRKLIYTKLKSKPFDTSKSRIFRTQHNKWLSCAQKFKVYVLGGQGIVMKRTWPSVSINSHSSIYCMSEKRNEMIHRVGNIKYAKNDECMKCLLYARSYVLSALALKFDLI